MKLKIKIEKEFDIKYLTLLAEVRYWEDALVNNVKDTEGNLIPHREGNNWCPSIDIETGVILNWPEETKAIVHYKVCDCLGFLLKDENNEIIIESKDGYVPNTLAPEGNGFGDYIIMNIDEKGNIDKWKFNINDFVE